MRISYVLGSCALILFTLSAAHAGLVITTTDSGSALAGAIVGTGVTIDGSSITYTGTGTGASGFFTGGVSAGIGIEEGILLTSGVAADAVGPNVSDETFNILGLPGSPELDALIPGFVTLDAVVLSFEFTTSSGDLFFDYVFASEEYNEFVDSAFNDVFAFFVNGVNIAIAPNGDPVAINNVNCGDPFVGAGPNCAFFNNNDPTDGGPFFDIEYDGFTDVFTASILGLGSGPHTFSAAIADAGDDVLDSGVFLKGESFSSENPQVPEPGTIVLLGGGIAVLLVARNRLKLFRNR